MYELSEEQYQKLKHYQWLVQDVMQKTEYLYQGGDAYRQLGQVAVGLDSMRLELDQQLDERAEARAALQQEFGNTLSREFSPEA